ncbi:MAG: hypothetical protein RR365_15330 [Bacteroides sp.]
MKREENKQFILDFINGDSSDGIPVAMWIEQPNEVKKQLKIN